MVGLVRHRAVGRTFRTKYWKYCHYQLVRSGSSCLTATEKQVHPGLLYMKPIQGHLKNNWRVPESLEKVLPIPRSLPPIPPLTMVATRRQCSYRSTITPNKTCSANIYRRIKRGVGRSLKRTHCKRVLVTSRKQAAYKLSGT